MDDNDKALSLEHLRLISGVLALAMAKPTTTTEAMRTVAYDLVMNGITPDIVEHQLERRSVPPSFPQVSAPTTLAPTDEEFMAIVERLQNSIRTWKGNEAYRRSLETELYMVLQFRRLDLGVRAIRRATVMGNVCDDVAWFDTITTLFDYCSLLLGDDVDTDALKPAYPHPSRRPKTQATPPKRRRTAP